MRARLAVALGLFGAAISCQRAAPTKRCVDADGDGRGRDCADGPDCDDADPSHASECNDAGVLECEAQPLAPGCPCLPGERDICYAAPSATLGVGLCKAGLARCSDGLWSDCDGVVLPVGELCNERDDDCDGLTDEGIQSPCGGCNPDCTGGVWGPPAAPFVPDAALDVTAFGELTLQRQRRAALTLWVPNTDEGTVSKIDVVSASEVARYRTRGQNPIRVAVDHRGDVWVLDGSVRGQAYATKIAGSAARCRDRNGDGVRSAERPEDIRPLGDDECVLLDLPLGAAGDDARALAVDGAEARDAERAGNVWVGLASAERVLVLDGDDGKQLAQLDVPDFHAYAAAFDSWGTLWMISRDGWLARIDPSQQPAQHNLLAVPFACYALEGLSIDAQGRLLLTGFGCESVLSYDPQRAAWRSAQAASLLTPRGSIALAEASWVTYTSGQIARVAREPLLIEPAASLVLAGTTPYETIALSADTRSQLWAISTQGGPDGRGLATGFDPQRAQVTAQVPVGRGPRGSGDLTGYALGAEFVREGQANHVFLGCGREAHETPASGLNIATQWNKLHFANLLGPGASIDVAVRHATSEQLLPARAFVMLGSLPSMPSPLPLELPTGGVVEVRLTLRSPAAIGAPRIARVGLEWTCPGPD